MVTLRGPNAFEKLAKRHEKRFAAMDRAFMLTMRRRQQDMAKEIMPMFMGFPIGDARLKALRRDDHPFAQRHRAPMWPTPPVGIISGFKSGGLLASLKFPLSGWTYGVYSLRAISAGSQAAPFILHPGGTVKMVDRRVNEAAYVATSMLCQRTSFELMMTQRGLL